MFSLEIFYGVNRRTTLNKTLNIIIDCLLKAKSLHFLASEAKKKIDEK